MQESAVIVSKMGQDIPHRVLREPVSVPWVAIRKTVNATAYHHDVGIQLTVRERRLRIGPYSISCSSIRRTLSLIAPTSSARANVTYRSNPCGPMVRPLTPRAEISVSKIRVTMPNTRPT
jgi:hypothetical protein